MPPKLRHAISDDNPLLNLSSNQIDSNSFIEKFHQNSPKLQARNNRHSKLLLPNPFIQDDAML